jgi:hypothetical protein
MLVPPGRFSLTLQAECRDRSKPMTPTSGKM